MGILTILTWLPIFNLDEIISGVSHYIYFYFYSTLIETNPQGKMGEEMGFNYDHYMNDKLYQATCTKHLLSLNQLSCPEVLKRERFTINVYFDQLY